MIIFFGIDIGSLHIDLLVGGIQNLQLIQHGLGYIQVILKNEYFNIQ